MEDASSVVRNHGRSPDQPAREKAAISVSAFADALETATTSDAAVVRGRAQLEILEVLRVEARALTLRQLHLATGLPAAELQPALKGLREVKMVTALNTVIESYKLCVHTSQRGRQHMVPFDGPSGSGPGAREDPN